MRGIRTKNIAVTSRTHYLWNYSGLLQNVRNVILHIMCNVGLHIRNTMFLICITLNLNLC